MTTVYEHPEQRRSVLTASGESMSRVDAEALGYAIAPYADLVAQSARIATRHPEYTDLVSLPPFGLTVQPGTAKALGFSVSKVTAASPRAVPSRPDPKASWRSSVYALTEAQERPAATAELLTSRTPLNLTLDQARAFLRGLPVEADHTDTTEETTMTTTDDPRSKRLAEISNSMSAFNRANGYKAAKAKPSLSDIEPAKLKRLAEMRLSALAAKGQAHYSEAKAIRWALDTHDKMGTPLTKAFAQSGFDVSTLLPSNL
ncbi:hypothetical protein MTR72_24845 [Bradyrhizobium sp. ISRA442]|uniref:hypothetical protein n=1 Tax=Bradyrhizobium sp. ISRA442 TaxID=2866197 RepID=UPI00311B1E68